VSTRLVLHVLPIDLFRGAQTYARELRVRLDSPGVRHRTLTLFRSSGGALQPDYAVDVRSGILRRAGLDPRAVLGLRRAVRRHAPDVVVAHGGEPLKYAVLAGVDARRLVYYKIGVEHGRMTGFRERTHRAMLRRAAMVAAVSTGAAREAQSFGVAASKVRVIPNGRDPSLFEVPSSSSGGVTGAPRLVWIGQFDASKRPACFLELMRELRQEGVDLTAAMAGLGPLHDSLQADARAAGVELLGSVADVPKLLAESDLLVFTGAPPEGMPGVLIEAAMAEVAVVTTAVPGADDVVVSDTTGLVVPVDDFGSLVHATRALVEDRDRRRRMGETARRRAVELFSLDASTAKWRALLDEMLTCTSSI
jgi:glycosyltransferase involved in cell wall biosynthesis